MPELADVEGLRRYLSRYATGRRIEGVSVLDRDVLRSTTPQALGRALKGHAFGTPERVGKWLLAPVDSSVVLLHFGMTGGLAWTSKPSQPEDSDRVTFHLKGGELRYRSQRKLGGVWLAKSRGEVDEITGPLGPDALETGWAQFRDLLQGRRRQIKPTLMDQKLISGLGNELSDEILWRAAIDPAQRASELDEATVDRLYDAMRDVLRRSVRHGRILRSQGWLNAVRGVREPACPRCGGDVRRSRVGGRTAYWCPRCQKK